MRYGRYCYDSSSIGSRIQLKALMMLSNRAFPLTANSNISRPNFLNLLNFIKHFKFYLKLYFWWWESLRTKSHKTYTAQKMKFSITDFFSKCVQIRNFLRIWSHLLKKSVMENFIFCGVMFKILSNMYDRTFLQK